MGLMVRTRGDPAGQLEAIRAAALGVDPTVVPFDVRTMVEASSRVIASDRALALVSSGFSLVALLLTGLGLYGLVARQIALRRKELGIRLALGARPESLVGSMAGHGLFIGGIALLLGVPSTLLAVRFLKAHLFHVEATDPASMAGAALGVLILSLLAAWIPARRAARVDPRESLAEE
jgi:ABC-type antimicrobial peptide transport system permease subunit